MKLEHVFLHRTLLFPRFPFRTKRRPPPPSRDPLPAPRGLRLFPQISSISDTTRFRVNLSLKKCVTWPLISLPPLGV
ncbi:Hypothetical predicted protein [Octopus vulgaris]|uniref:Uncharacterized protein n=1 Tax=Octopus vulgaris TaxID=6645 RepID=A0AA36F7H6_OCTVU|nr:Hypothetical predicted protein [Octopus vulgaris]